jgi:hypothetical protein
VRDNGRIVVTLCAFEGPARAVRLHGRGDVVQIGEAGFAELEALFDFDHLPAAAEATRAIVVGRDAGRGGPRISLCTASGSNRATGAVVACVCETSARHGSLGVQSGCGASQC